MRRQPPTDGILRWMQTGDREVGWRAGLALVMLMTLGFSDGASAGWPHERADPDATNRGTGVGQIKNEAAYLPGFSHLREVREAELGDVYLRDIDDDDFPEAVVTYRGRLAAIDLETGQLKWASPARGIDAIISAGNFDMSDDAEEFLVAASALGGGLHVVDSQSGALLGSISGLVEKTGVRADEITMRDLDGDQNDEIVFAASVLGVDRVWATNFAPGYDISSTVEVGFSGYDNLTPPRVGALLGEGRVGIVIDQGHRQSVFGVCQAADADAVCGEAPGQVCLCDLGAFTGVHPTSSYGFGTSFVLDTDDDGVEEVVFVDSHASYTNAVGVLSFADGLEGGSHDTEALRRWYRSYDSAEPYTRLVTPKSEPRDLNGDGSIDLLVTYQNNVGLDVDANGDPLDDGIDNPGGVSLAIFEAATGDVQAVLDNVYAYGYADINGDGKWEVITSPTEGWSFKQGLRGYDLECNPSCTLNLAWEAPGHAVVPDLESFNGTGMPPASFWSLDADNDADPELAAYSGGALELLDVNAGTVEAAATVALEQGEQVEASDEATRTLLTATPTHLRLRESDLTNPSGPVELPKQGVARWRAAPLMENDVRDVTVFEARAYPEGVDAQNFFEFLPEVVLLEDLDGDGRTEVVSTRGPADELGPGHEIRVHEWDPDAGDFAHLWSVTTNGHPSLNGAILAGPLHFASGDFDGIGGRELVVPVRLGSSRFVAVFNAADGNLDELLPSTQTQATNAPLIVADLASKDGTLVPDGLDDVVVHGSNRVELLTPGYPGPIQSFSTSFYHGVSSNVDIDGDGERELVATLSASSMGEAVAHDLDFSADPLWGPLGIGRPSDAKQVLSFGDVDNVPGFDVLQATGDGSLDAYAGSTGVLLPGFPVYLSGGEVSEEPDEDAAPALALAVVDVDDDGDEEAIVGTAEGYVYAVNVAADEGMPSLEWAVLVGDAVVQLAVADPDGDGYQEILVASNGGQGLVIDSLGVFLDITAPEGDQCYGATTVEVVGVSEGISEVDLSANAVPGDQGVDASNGKWSGEVLLEGGPGKYELEARGRNLLGNVVAIDKVTIEFEGDEDGDGVTACGGDCEPENDSVYPGAEEVCGDDIDQDCDGEDLPCGGGDGGGTGGWGETGTGEGGDLEGGGSVVPGGCGCRSSANPRAPNGPAFGFLLALAIRRRRRRAAV